MVKPIIHISLDDSLARLHGHFYDIATIANLLSVHEYLCQYGIECFGQATVAFSLSELRHRGNLQCDIGFLVRVDVNRELVAESHPTALAILSYTREIVVAILVQHLRDCHLRYGTISNGLVKPYFVGVLFIILDNHVRTRTTCKYFDVSLRRIVRIVERNVVGRTRSRCPIDNLVIRVVLRDGKQRIVHAIRELWCYDARLRITDADGLSIKVVRHFVGVVNLLKNIRKELVFKRHKLLFRAYLLVNFNTIADSAILKRSIKPIGELSHITKEHHLCAVAYGLVASLWVAHYGVKEVNIVKNDPLAHKHKVMLVHRARIVIRTRRSLL